MKTKHKTNGIYKCEKCDYCAKSYSTFFFHLTTKHGIGEIKHQCDMCLKPFKNNSLLLLHKEQVHFPKTVKERKQIKCEICDKTFTTNLGLKYHMGSIHDQYDIQPKDLLKKCDMCDQEFYEPNLLNEHLKDCLENHKNFTCKFCDTTWISHKSLELHFTVDHKKVLHVCDICGISKIDHLKLRTHVKHVHDKKLDHICHICGHPFSLKHTLHQHLASVHDIGEKTYLCDQCPKAYVTKATLENHKIAVHVHEKSYQCEICDWSGYTKNMLRKHMQYKHIRDKVYPCEQCDYKAYCHDWLKQHIRNIHDKQK